MTGNPYLDRWWARAFRQWRPRTQYNGFVFRLTDDDMPAMFGHWLHGPIEKPHQTIAELEREFRESIIFRLGDCSTMSDPQVWMRTPPEEKMRLGREIVANDEQVYRSVLDCDPQFLNFVFEDYQIVLSRPIAAKRILSILPGGNDYGRNIARAKKETAFKRSVREV